MVELSGLFFVSVERAISFSAASEAFKEGIEARIEPNANSESTDHLTIACKRHRTAARGDNHSLCHFGIFQAAMFEVPKCGLSALLENRRHTHPCVLFDLSIEIDESSMLEVR